MANCGCGNSGCGGGCGCDGSDNTAARCGNPCLVTQTNTPACESVPSQITNFTAQFFGTVVKTEIGGVVQWSLPCNLDTGLPNNPRTDGEGLACYFLRLFLDGIVGFTGPQGAAGSNGADGNNAYTVSLQGFVQPSLANPNVQFKSVSNPAILPGLYVFVQSSGWYLVNQVDGSGNLFLSLSKAVPGAPAFIPAGKLVVPSGYPGASVTGPQGVQGPKGDKGDAGDLLTKVNSQFSTNVGTDFNFTTVATKVDFVNAVPEVLLPNKGTYLVNMVMGLNAVAGVALSDVLVVFLQNITNSQNIAGSEQHKSAFVTDQLDQIVISAIVTTDGDDQTVSIFGSCTTSAKVYAVALRTAINYVRLQ